MEKTIFSGIQPSGVVHIGNYFGAIKQWVDLQDKCDLSIYSVVDMHAITVQQDPQELKENIYSMAALYLAVGLNPEKSILFVQSSRPEHTELAWLLNCHATMGELNRMTQYKEKSQNKNDSVSVGLFDYPVLMAADILLYGATDVPVGDDQKQHVELTRDIAERFNARYGEIFVLPKPIIKSSTARIMGLDNPQKKMSKSAMSANNYIAMSDNAETISLKIKKAVTDSGNEIRAAKEKPAITNLLNIYSEVSGLEIEMIENKYRDKGYGVFKSDLTDLLIEYLCPIQKKYKEYLEQKDQIRKILEEGSDKLQPRAQEMLTNVKKVIGIGF